MKLKVLASQKQSKQLTKKKQQKRAAHQKLMPPIVTNEVCEDNMKRK